MILYAKKQGGRVTELIWLATAQAYSQTLTFATEDVSDGLTDDEVFDASAIYPDAVPKEIDKGVCAAIITEISTITNNTGIQLAAANLLVSYALKTPATVSKFYRGRPMSFATGGALVDVKGQMVYLTKLQQPVELRRSSDDFQVRVTDRGSLLASATASSLTLVLAGFHTLLMCWGISPEAAYQRLRGFN